MIKLIKLFSILYSVGNSKLYICISTSLLFVVFCIFMNKELDYRMRMLDYYPRHEMSGGTFPKEHITYWQKDNRENRERWQYEIHRILKAPETPIKKIFCLEM